MKIKILMSKLTNDLKSGLNKSKAVEVIKKVDNLLSTRRNFLIEDMFGGIESEFELAFREYSIFQNKKEIFNELIENGYILWNNRTIKDLEYFLKTCFEHLDEILSGLISFVEDYNTNVFSVCKKYENNININIKHKIINNNSNEKHDVKNEQHKNDSKYDSEYDSEYEEDEDWFDEDGKFNHEAYRRYSMNEPE